ncbi:MAG: hypothetical protein ACLTYN_06530 [Dysosmobacter welbionis]
MPDRVPSHLCPPEGGENDKPVKKVTAEARFVAARIRKLLDEGYPVTESDGTLRPCRPEDIVILMRSPAAGLPPSPPPWRSGTSPVLSRRAGTSSTPWRSPSCCPCWRSWTTPAGRASDLRPPVTPVRLHGGPAGGGSLRRPHRGLLRRCDRRWGRGLQRLPGNPLGSAAGGPGHECPPPGLAHLQPTECAGVFGAMDDGAARRENLIALSQHAEKFESNGYRGLFAFVTQLRRLLEQDQAPATGARRRLPACGS